MLPKNIRILQRSFSRGLTWGPRRLYLFGAGITEIVCTYIRCLIISFCVAPFTSNKQHQIGVYATGKLMKYLLAFLLLSPVTHAAQPISMTNTDSDYNTPAFGYTTCSYKQSYGYSAEPLRIKIIVEGMCPYSIKYDPTTGTWSK